MPDCTHALALAQLRPASTDWVHCPCGMKLRNTDPPQGASDGGPIPGAPEASERSREAGRGRQSARPQDAERALSNLARWLPVIEGRAAGLEPVIASSPRNGRSDPVDEHHRDLRAAYETLDRLAHTHRLHRRVLLFAYGWMGTDTRTGWDGRDQRIDKPLWDGTDARMALVFAAPYRRLAWLSNPAVSMARSAMILAGRQMRQHALAAFHAATPVQTDGAWLPHDRDWITRSVREADTAAKVLNRTREQNRVAPTRKQRREALQPPTRATEAIQAMDKG